MHKRLSLAALGPTLASALAIAVAAPAFAQQGSVRDFRLPPEATPTSNPDVQGPVDPDAPVRTAPRAIGTPTPTPSTQPSPVPTQAPLRLPEPTPTPTPAATRAASPARTGQAAQAAPDAVRTPASSIAADVAPAQAERTASALPDTQSAPILPSTNQPPAAVANGEGGFGTIAWLGALIAALGAVGAGAWVLRRRQQEAMPVPAIEPPLARRTADPAPRPSAPPAPEPAAQRPIPKAAFGGAATVSLGAQPVRFSRSVMNATFSYRVVIENRGTERWEDLALEADLVTAHGKAPIAEQIADPAVPLAPVRTLATLEPGETIELAGDVRLPLQQVRAIPQGRAAVYVPLLRLRVAAKGKAAIAKTYLIGQLPDREGGRLQPFRLDETPQSYNAIGLRALD